MGKPGKLKSGTKNKLKRWSKGNSSSSNPSTLKFREKARSSFFQKQVKPNKGLTKESLKLHNQLKGDTELENDCMTVDSDERSESAETFATFLSGVSDCTNVTFRRIQKYWLSNSSEYKEVCAVLAAITEVLREQKGDESNTAYFAALMTALSSVEKIESATAILYLLSMTVKKVPVAVLKAKFSEVSKLLCDILGQTSTKKRAIPTALIKSVLTILATLLRHQDLTSWENASTVNVFNSILVHINHSKPKVRKASQDAVCSVLYGSDFLKNLEESQDFFHPAAVLTANACVTQLENMGGLNSSSGICHILTLIGRIFPCFPKASLKKACESIMRIMTLSDTLVKSICMQSLEGIFQKNNLKSSLTPELNAQIITALYDYYPNASDVTGTPIWLAVMEKAVLNLCSQYMSSKPMQQQAIHFSLIHIPKLLITCFKLLLSQNDVISKAAAVTAKSLMTNGIDKFWNVDGIVIENDVRIKFVQSVIKILEDGLKFKFHPVWGLIFNLIETAFKHIFKSTDFEMLKSLIESMANLRNTPHFQNKTELDFALGSVISIFGPKLFLDVVPLQIDGTDADQDFARSWLLPLLQRHIKNVTLDFFSEYFLPLAMKLHCQVKELEKSHCLPKASLYKTLFIQCWELLPIFCKQADDIPTGFPKIARVMGRALEESKDLQQIVMSALRNLVSLAKKSESDIAIVSAYCKNFLPILFNLYTNTKYTAGIHNDDSEEMPAANKSKSLERLAALETIRILIAISPKDLINGYFIKVQTKLFNDANLGSSARLALLDLLISMISFVSEDADLENLYGSLKDMLNNPNRSLQKKGYRVLQEICGSHSQLCVGFVKSHLLELEDVLLNGLTTASLPSKGPRICSMEQVYLLLKADSETEEKSREFLLKAIPEVIMCTNEAKRSRIAAFNLLVNAAKAFITVDSENGEQKLALQRAKLEEYFDIVSMGLSGSTSVMKATIVALSRLVFEFKDQLSSKLLNNVTDNMCVLLSSNTREITKAAFGFVFVLLRILRNDQFAQHLKNILHALFNWKDATRRYFKQLVKKLLVRVVRKYGYDTIHSMVPEEHKKQLAYIQKQAKRAKRHALEHKTKNNENGTTKVIHKDKKETMDEILAFSDSDFDSDNEKEPLTKQKRIKTKGRTWLQEEVDEPLNLLDPSVSQKLLMADPKAPKKPKKEEFKTTPDGRLIIYEGKLSDDESDEKILKSLGINKKLETANSIENTSVNNRKRKLEADDLDDNFEDTEHIPKKMAYKPGGKGIHRANKNEETGARFKAKNAGGDIKRKGSQQPYAYLPFNRQALNKRKQKKLTGQYTGFVKSAKKGAAKGLRNKSKNRTKA